MKLVKPNLLDVLVVCRNLREADRREIYATRWTEDVDALAIDVMQTWVGPISAVTLYENRPVAVWGIRESWPSVWSAWLIATDEFPKIGLGMTKVAKRRILPHLVELGAKRVEARSIDGHESAHQWLKALGCVQEARLRRYGRNGEDFLVFRWDADVPA